MGNLGRILLALAALLAAFTVGVLVGRGERAEPVSPSSEGVTITTEDAAPPPVTEPLVAPVQAPPAAAPIPQAAPDVQVQEDAAAVGMTTRDEPRIDDRDEPTTPPDAAESAPPAPGQ